MAMQTLPERAPRPPARPCDFTRVSDLTSDGLRRLLELAAALKESPRDCADALRGESIACIFEKRLDVVIGCPPGYAPDPRVLARARTLAASWSSAISGRTPSAEKTLR